MFFFPAETALRRSVWLLPRAVSRARTCSARPFVFCAASRDGAAGFPARPFGGGAFPPCTGAVNKFRLNPGALIATRRKIFRSVSSLLPNGPIPKRSLFSILRPSTLLLSFSRFPPPSSRFPRRNSGDCRRTPAKGGRTHRKTALRRSVWLRRRAVSRARTCSRAPVFARFAGRRGRFPRAAFRGRGVPAAHGCGEQIWP
jgi:hypothetical protein